MRSEDKVTLCRVVGVMILSDGQLTDAEYDFFYELMDRLELTDSEREEVRGSVQIDANVRADIEALRSHGELRRLLNELRSAASIDGTIAPIEATMMSKIESILSDEDD